MPAFGSMYYDPGQERSTTSIHAQLEALATLVRQGKVRAIGLSNETPYGVHEFVRLAEQHGLPRIATVQNPYCLVNRGVDNGLDETLHRLDVALLAYSPLGFGLLTGKYDASGTEGAGAPPAARLVKFESYRTQRWGRPESLAAARRYNALARQHGLTPTRMALAWCYGNWRVASTLVGVTSLARASTSTRCSTGSSSRWRPPTRGSSTSRTTSRVTHRPRDRPHLRLRARSRSARPTRSRRGAGLRGARRHARRRLPHRRADRQERHRSIIRDAEREQIFDEYADRVGETVTGTVQQSRQPLHAHQAARGRRGAAAADRAAQQRALRPQPAHQGLHHRRAQDRPTSRRSSCRARIRACIRRLFELEVPEIYDGIVEIKSVAREPGMRSKIAVSSREPGLDPVGACVGPKGSRVRMVVGELRGERIDVVPWNDDPATYVAQRAVAGQGRPRAHRRGRRTPPPSSSPTTSSRSPSARRARTPASPPSSPAGASTSRARRMAAEQGIAVAAAGAPGRRPRSSTVAACAVTSSGRALPQQGAPRQLLLRSAREGGRRASDEGAQGTDPHLHRAAERLTTSASSCASSGRPRATSRSTRRARRTAGVRTCARHRSASRRRRKRRRLDSALRGELERRRLRQAATRLRRAARHEPELAARTVTTDAEQ